MKDYWDKRFASEGRIWGDTPSKTAIYAAELFRKDNVSRILVPGSGYGRNASYFSAQGFDVTGIEISGNAMEIAKGLNPQIIYHSGSVLDMPFDNNIFDAIYCFNVLHLFRENDRKNLIDKCLKQLHDNGSIFFTVFSEKEASFGKGTKVEANTFESKPGRPVHYFDEKDLNEHFKGLNIIETGLMEDPENHGDEGEHVHVVRYIFAKKA